MVLNFTTITIANLKLIIFMMLCVQNNVLYTFERGAE